MKVLLYSKGLKKIGKSGLGKAIHHQMEALENSYIEYTTDEKCENFDIVHINFYNPSAYFFAKKARKMGKKIVYHAHSTEEDFRNSFPGSNFFSPVFKKWICKCYKLGDVIITPTEYSQELLSTYNLGKPIYALSNGINMDFFEKNEKKGKEFRKKFGFKKDQKVIMAVGLYFKRKGILEFIELAKRMPEYEFVWFGFTEKYLVSKDVRKALKTELPNLHFPGYVEPEILKCAYSGADLFIFPTKEETEGIPILEAFTSKINTIVSDIPVFDWAVNGKDVYKAKSVDEFEIMIKKILNNEIPSLVENGYKCVQNKDIKEVRKQLIEIYKELHKKK